MSAEERERLMPTITSDLNAQSSDSMRRNSSTSRFHVTPSSSCINNLVGHSSSHVLNNLPDSNNGNQQQFRKGSAPASMPQMLSSVFVVTENVPSSSHDPSSPIKAVQFNVGENDDEKRSTDNQATLNENDNTINMNLQSWRNMQTLDHPPLLDFYRNSTDEEGSAVNRPSMLELLHGGKKNKEMDDFEEENVHIVDQQMEKEEAMSSARTGRGSHLGNVVSSVLLSDGGKTREVLTGSSTALNGSLSSTKNLTVATHRKKFGWIEGVFFRCVLNIFGVILYLRVSWVTGQSGLLLGNLIVLLASLVTTITALSCCAICTNGDVKAGGAYFMISRSLGPSFGGSIGLIFSLANAVAAAMYIVGFAETIRDILRENGLSIIDGGLNDVRIVGLVTCAVLICIVFIGTGFESKMQMGLLVILLLSILDYGVGSFLYPNDRQQRRGITGYSYHTFKENLLPAFRGGYNFFDVFSIYFPAATGIMAGANISGDLTNPQKAIPKGTLIAIAFTTIVYLLLITATGSTCLRDADGLHLPTLLTSTWNTSIDDLTPVEPTALLSSYYAPACSINQTCPYGLLNYFQVIEESSLWGPLITAGIIAASLSSALASLVSAPKIFQAVCKDKLFPYINYFGKGYGTSDEPRRGYVLTFCLSMVVICVGELNLIAPVISNFFLASYALINYACFDNSMANSPGWRPGFYYYNKWVSLIGALLCVAIMFIVSWQTALLTFFFFGLLLFYLSHRKLDINWGSSTQAHSYRNALHSITRLEHVDEHVKNYRPQILVLTGNPAARPSLVDFIGNITKDNSLMISAYVVPYSPSDQVFGMLGKLNDQLKAWLKKRKIKSFYVSVANPSLRAGVQSLIQTTGLGKLKPNVLAMGFKSDWLNSDMKSIDEYFGIVQDSFDRNLGVMILRTSSGGLDFSDLMRTHNVGDTGRLKLPEMTAAMRHNTSERSLTCAAAIAASIPAKAIAVNESGVMKVVNQQGSVDNSAQSNHSMTSSEPQDHISNQGSFRSQTNPPEENPDDYVSCTETESESNAEEASNNNDVTIRQEQKQEPEIVVDDKKQKTVNFTYYERVDAEESAAIQERRKLVNRRSSRRMTAAQRDLLSSINRFQRKIKKGTIDVWWLYDDGGLSLLVPYLISQPKSYLEHAKLRVFTISTSSSGIEQEHRNMAALLSKFRIAFSDITIIPDVGRKPKPETLEQFNRLIEPFRGDEEGQISDADLISQKDRTMRQLRVSELLRKHSVEADLIVLSMPIPRKNITKAPMYLAWLEVMTHELPPTLLVRGNQTSVLTFYS